MNRLIARRQPGTYRWLVPFALIPTLLAGLPVLYVVLRSSEAGWRAAWLLVARPRILELLLNTLTLAVAVTAASAVIGIAAAWCVERTTLPGRRTWRVVLSLPLAVPAFVSSYAWSSLGGRFEGLGGAIVILTLSSYPLVYLAVCVALQGMDAELEEVARSLGRGRPAIFFRVVLPQAQPAIGAGALLIFSHMLAEFGALSLLRVQTFTTAIFQEYELQFNNEMAALLSAILLILCLPAVALEMRLRGRIRRARPGGGIARRPALTSLGRATLAVQLALTLLAGAALGMPLGILAFWLAHGTSAAAIGSDLGAALVGSLGLSVPGALLTTALAAPLVLIAARQRGALGLLAERLPYAIHGLPGLVVALALIYFTIRYAPGIYQTTIVVLAAYALLFAPLAQSTIRASVELAPAQWEQVARSLGRSPAGAFLSVILPNIAAGLGAGAALVFLELMRELTATLLLAPTGVTTLATEVWSHTRDTEYAAAAPFAACLVLISGLPVYLFTVRSMRTRRLQAP